MDEQTPPAIRSTCPYCGVGCGVLLRQTGPSTLTVEGDPQHPANKGRLCSKGLALGETTSLDDRLLTPKIHGKPAAWDAALQTVADRFSQTIAEHGPDSVAFYVSGQLLTEDYYVANKLMKGFIGSANIDTNSRLCMASTVAGHKRAFGTDTVPGLYSDLEQADVVTLVGSNLAWCHPVLYQRLAAAKQERGTKIVVIDPRRTATCDIADLHLALKPGTDVALFNGLLSHLDSASALNHAFIAEHTTGFAQALTTAHQSNPAATGLPARDLEAFFEIFARHRKSVTVFSQGVNQSSSGTDKVNAILNCHLATGRIGQPGMGPLSVTGQPNAMGGREVGGLANTLAAHLDLEDDTHRAAVRTFWQSPTIAAQPGLKAIEMFRAVEAGRIKALWIAGTNPVVSLPEAGNVARAIETCPFTVVSDLTEHTDTARRADVLLPATGWGEKDGTVTNSDRTISRQRPALPKPGEARHDWEIFSEVGARMGWPEAFAFQNPAQIFREHAALSGIAAAQGRDFDISAFAANSDAEYTAFKPARWPQSATQSGGRFFGDGRFFTPDHKARCVAVTQRAPATKRSPRFPYRLNTGRIRDQWHTMTRTGLSPRLSRHLAEPYLQIHPADAEQIGLEPAFLARLTSPTGTAILRTLISPDVPPGAPFAPMHWSEETAPAARIGTLISAATDPVSGQPESKASVVAIEPFDATWYGFALSLTEPQPTSQYWARTRTETGWRVEMACTQPPDNGTEGWTDLAQSLFGLSSEPQTFTDPARRRTHLAFRDSSGALTAALFVAPQPVAVARDYIASLLGRTDAALPARPPGDQPQAGPTVCACMNVGRTTILSAIAQGCTTAEAIGAATSAGTSCGSCRPELTDLIAHAAQLKAAE